MPMQGELTLRFVQNKKSFQQNWPAQVRFVRPAEFMCDRSTSLWPAIIPLIRHAFMLNCKILNQ